MANNKRPMKEPAVQEATEEKKFQLEELKKNCMKLFGVTSSTFAGATANIPNGKYSMQEIKQQIEKWKGQEVK